MARRKKQVRKTAWGAHQGKKKKDREDLVK